MTGVSNNFNFVDQYHQYCEAQVHKLWSLQVTHDNVILQDDAGLYEMCVPFLWDMTLWH